MITTKATKDASRFVPARLAATLRAALCSAALIGAVSSATPALADGEGHGGALRLLHTIAFPSSVPALHGFDISWIDAATQRYYLADRSGAAIDVIDIANGTFLTPITVTPPFAGVKFNAAGAANNALSGPHGVTTSGRWLFATDAGSRVVSIDLTTNKVVSDLKLDPSANRADELAYDPVGGNLLVVNNADTPPFGTLVKVDPATGKMTKGQKILFNTAGGVNATNGAEQPVWDRRTGKFYVSVPEIDCSATATPACTPGAGPVGAVVSISPTSTGKVDAVFKVQHCQPAGLTLGPRGDLLLGCGVVFDTAGNVWSATGTTTAAPISIILNPKDGIAHQVAGVSGSDEVWYNAGDGNYYLAARNNSGGPVMGVVNARSKELTQLVPTINVAATPNKFPAGTAHSIAVNRRNNQVFVPLAANNVFPGCLNGCVAVFAAPGGRDD
jgi:hypothetical protein